MKQPNKSQPKQQPQKDPYQQQPSHKPNLPGQKPTHPQKPQR